MSREVIAKASEIIKNKSTEGEKIGAGIALTLIDNDGYPTTSCVSISKANGIRELLFGIGLSSKRANRAKQCTRAAICIFDDDYEGNSYYNITLVGDVEVVTDQSIKEKAWHDGMYKEHFEQGVSDPDFAVLRFTTKRYNLWVDMGEEVTGSFDVQTTNTLQGTSAQTTPRFEPILIYNNGQCGDAISLYEKPLVQKY